MPYASTGRFRRPAQVPLTAKAEHEKSKETARIKREWLQDRRNKEIEFVQAMEEKISKEAVQAKEIRNLEVQWRQEEAQARFKRHEIILKNIETKGDAQAKVLDAMGRGLSDLAPSVVKFVEKQQAEKKKALAAEAQRITARVGLDNAQLIRAETSINSKQAFDTTKSKTILELKRRHNLTWEEFNTLRGDVGSTVVKKVKFDRDSNIDQFRITHGNAELGPNGESFNQIMNDPTTPTSIREAVTNAFIERFLEGVHSEEYKDISDYRDISLKGIHAQINALRRRVANKVEATEENNYEVTEQQKVAINIKEYEKINGSSTAAAVVGTAKKMSADGATPAQVKDYWKRVNKLIDSGDIDRTEIPEILNAKFTHTASGEVMSMSAMFPEQAAKMQDLGRELSQEYQEAAQRARNEAKARDVAEVFEFEERVGEIAAGGGDVSEFLQGTLNNPDVSTAVQRKALDLLDFNNRVEDVGADSYNTWVVEENYGLHDLDKAAEYGISGESLQTIYKNFYEQRNADPGLQKATTTINATANRIVVGALGNENPHGRSNHTSGPNYKSEVANEILSLRKKLMDNEGLDSDAATSLAIRTFNDALEKRKADPNDRLYVHKNESTGELTAPNIGPIRVKPPMTRLREHKEHYTKTGKHLPILTADGVRLLVKDLSDGKFDNPQHIQSFGEAARHQGISIPRTLFNELNAHGMEIPEQLQKIVNEQKTADDQLQAIGIDTSKFYREGSAAGKCTAFNGILSSTPIARVYTAETVDGYAIVHTNPDGTPSGKGYYLDTYGRPLVFNENTARSVGMLIRDGHILVGEDGVTVYDMTSTKRSEQKNYDVGGATNSLHLDGAALDIHGASQANLVALKDRLLIHYGLWHLIYTDRQGRRVGWQFNSCFAR